MARSFGRIVFALTGAGFGAFAVALSEARQVVAVAEGAHAPGFWPVALGEIGVLAPVAVAVGAAVGALALFLEPGRPVSPGERIAAVRAQPVLARSRLAALSLLAGPAGAGWLVVTAHTARRTLSEGAPLAAGGALAFTALAWLLGVAALALALLSPMRRALASGASRWPAALDPITTFGLGLLVAAAALGAGVLSGDTGGEGSGPLAIFGVLRRTELDLRPAFDLAAIGACAWIGPLALGGRPARPAPLTVALALVLGPVALTAREARALEDDPAIARAIERQAPLGRIGLALARRATDRDHDGASPYFGGGDCNDHDPNISPFAVEIPGNGIDEDCSGADLPLPPRVVAPPAPTARGPAVARNFNLMLITVDTLRASEVGFLGYDKGTTPALDALAKESVVFDRVYAMASYTGKALAPMIIGRYPSETLRDGGHFNTYAPGNQLLAERLHEAGLATLGAASHWYFRDRWGVTQGFDTMDLSAMPPWGQGDTDSTTTGKALTDAGVKLLGTTAGRRFFLWTHYFDPHAQYVPHEGAPDFGSGARTPDDKARAAYDGEVWFTDQQVGRLLDYARAQPWWDDTVVVVTSDHGEALGEHGIHSQHGWEIWEALMRIPLLIRVPGVAPHHVALKRSAIDLVPTVLDLMRVPQPAPGELSGQSLAPDVFAKAGDVLEERDVYLDMPDGPFTHMRRGIIHGATPGMKLVSLGGKQYQLYDLAADPGEREDLASDPAKLQPMVDALSAKRATLREITVKPDAPAGP